jgi:hypothetical protein
METSAMAMPWGMARRTSSRASTRMGDPSAEVPAPAARPGGRRSAGLRVEAMPARCIARRKIPFRMSWHSVNCWARAEQRMACMWSKSVWRRAAPQQHCTAGALGGSMVRPRRCRRPVWTLQAYSLLYTGPTAVRVRRRPRSPLAREVAAGRFAQPHSRLETCEL